MAATTPVVITEHSHLDYGDRAVVEDLAIDLPRGAVTAIVGPNGCGKGTVLRSLARLCHEAWLLDTAAVLGTPDFLWPLRRSRRVQR